MVLLFSTFFRLLAAILWFGIITAIDIFKRHAILINYINFCVFSASSTAIKVLPGFIEFYWVLLGFYWVLPSFPDFHQVLPSFFFWSLRILSLVLMSEFIRSGKVWQSSLIIVDVPSFFFINLIGSSFTYDLPSLKGRFCFRVRSVAAVGQRDDLVFFSLFSFSCFMSTSNEIQRHPKWRRPGGQRQRRVGDLQELRPGGADDPAQRLDAPPARHAQRTRRPATGELVWLFFLLR